MKDRDREIREGCERMLVDKLREDLDQAEVKAWDALGRYKFQMFGYWAAIWVHLNRVGGFGRRNPWRALVLIGRTRFRKEAA